MKQVVFTKKGGVDVIQVQTVDDVEPINNEVRIRVKASGINFADILVRQGFYPDAPPFPCVVGYEVAGIVDKVGPSASADWIGRAVVAITPFKGYADALCVAETTVVPKPEQLSFVDAASLPVVYLTAWMLVYELGGLRGSVPIEGASRPIKDSPSSSILVHNAGGGVGLAAIGLAKHLGTNLIIGTASKGKHALLKEEGAHFLIDYRTEDVSKRVKELTNGKGVGLILDPIGGPASWKSNYDCLAPGGKLGAYGFSLVTEHKSMFHILKTMLSLFLTMPKWSPLTLMNDNRGVFGVNLGHMFSEAAYLVQVLSYILETAASGGWVKPHVDSVFSLDRTADAHAYIEARKNFGKVMLVSTEEDAVAWAALNAKGAKE